MRRIQSTKQNCWKINIFPRFDCLQFFGGELPVKQCREETHTLYSRTTWQTAAAASSCVEYETGNQRHYYVIYVSVEPYANNPSAVLLCIACPQLSQLKLHPKSIFTSKSHFWCPYCTQYICKSQHQLFFQSFIWQSEPVAENESANLRH